MNLRTLFESWTKWFSNHLSNPELSSGPFLEWFERHSVQDNSGHLLSWQLPPVHDFDGLWEEKLPIRHRSDTAVSSRHHRSAASGSLVVVAQVYAGTRWVSSSQWSRVLSLPEHTLTVAVAPSPLGRGSLQREGGEWSFVTIKDAIFYAFFLRLSGLFGARVSRDAGTAAVGCLSQLQVDEPEHFLLCEYNLWNDAFSEFCASGDAEYPASNRIRRKQWRYVKL